MSTHPIARKITKQSREGAKIVLPTGAIDDIQFIHPKNRIAACMILGDGYERKELIDCVNSIKYAGVDKLFIAYNGKTRRSLAWLWAHLKKLELPFLVQKFGWEEDFALARNQSFALVPKDEFDWMFWIDSDDVLECETQDSLQQMLNGLDPYTTGVYLRYDYAVDPESGAVAVQQWRERILSTKSDWQWIYPVHEVVFSATGTQFARRSEVWIKHSRKVGEPDDAARTRNRKIIARALKENPDNPRMQFYFANEVMAEADGIEDGAEKFRVAGAAVLAFQRFLTNETAPQEDMYMAATRVGELYLMRGEHDKAIDAFLNSIKIIPEWPDSYIGIARAAMELEDWPKCKAFSEISLKMSTPTTPSAITPLTHKYTPLLLRGIANEEMGNLKEAEEDYLAAHEVWNPPNGMLDDRIKTIKQKIAGTKQDKDLRKSLRGQRPEKSIAFVTAPSVEPWHPELEKDSGCGGSETAIMRLAPRFAADGWRTVVFGTPGLHRGVDENGVEYWNSSEFLPNEEFTVLVASRYPEVYETISPSKVKLLWMHDVNLGFRLPPFVERIDKIIALTNWHSRHLQRIYQLPEDKLTVMPNGIELDWYDWSKKKEGDGDLRLIWSSSPDRGLATLISLWPNIKEVYPTSRLDIFYGWEFIDKLLKQRKINYLVRLKQDIMNNIALLGGEDGGIYMHGRVPQKELAEWQLNAHIWSYPTEFMETFCITAIEVQAAGAIPITSKLAALQETVANSDLLIDGWPLNKNYQQNWLNKFEEVVDSSDERHEELQLSGRRFAEQFSWDKTYAKWVDLIRSMNG